MTALAALSVVVSILALTVSGITAWLTLLRRGTVKMTQPTVIYFGPDGGWRERPPLKVFLRTLLYATGKRGCIVEGMFIRLRRGETSQNFSVWVYGETGNLHRGSGLAVPEGGIAADHHFVLPSDGTPFQFLPGSYALDVFAILVGDHASLLLYSIQLELSSDHANALLQPEQGVYFDWGPDAGRYYAHVRPHPAPPALQEMLP